MNNENRLPIEKCICVACAKEYFRKMRTRGGPNKFCSKECAYKYGTRRGIPLSNEARKKLSEKYMGSGSPSWKGGINKNKEWVKVRARELRRKKRKMIIDILGGKCACCGEKEYQFLAIDHIHGGGRKEMLANKNSQLFQLVIKQGIPRDKYQILCYNCNFAKGHWGKCPHNQSSAGHRVPNDLPRKIGTD